MFTNLDNEDYDFIPNTLNRVRRFSPSVTMRMEERSRMEEHGRHPTTPYNDALIIQHEGMTVGSTDEAASAEREAMTDVLFPHLDGIPSESKFGTLTIRKANWTNDGYADVGLESWSVDMGIETIRHLPYTFVWVVYQGYFLDSYDDETILLP